MCNPLFPLFDKQPLLNDTRGASSFMFNCRYTYRIMSGSRGGGGIFKDRSYDVGVFSPRAGLNFDILVNIQRAWES